MKRVAMLIAAASCPAPVLAQHAGHEAPSPPPVDPHAGHVMPAPAPPSDPHAGHAMPPAPPPAPAADPHQGHVMEPAAPAADPHAGHRISGEAAASPAPPVAPPPPEALAGPAHAADPIFGADAMAEAREELRAVHGDMRSYRFAADLLELRVGDGAEVLAWEDLQFWYGGDIDKLWIKSQGEARFGEGVESAEVQALWSRAVTPFFDLQAGLRYDVEPAGRGYAVVGIQGLAPYWFEVDGAVFLSDRGDVSARFEAEYDLRITQRLILQPRAEAEVSLHDVPELAIGSGLSTAEAGLRLRYEILPEFAPYAGLHYERAFDDAARFRRAAGEDAGGWSLVFGLRAWF